MYEKKYKYNSEKAEYVFHVLFHETFHGGLLKDDVTLKCQELFPDYNPIGHAIYYDTIARG